MKKGILFLFVLLIITVGLLIFIKSEIERTGIDKTLKTKRSQDNISKGVEIDYLDIGQGDATFITFPNGEQMLIDCAVDARVIEALGRVMPFYDRDIDYLVVTHPDLDHYGGCIDVLNRFDVGTVVYNGIEKPHDTFWNAFHSRIEEHIANGKQFILAEEATTWDIASTTVQFLYPDHSLVDDENIPGDKTLNGANDTSIVVKLSYGDMNALFTGDAEKELEEYLIATYGDQLDVEILKVGHHGSNTSSIDEFVSSTSPSVAIVSAGENNKFGHPSPRILKRFERAGTAVWRTDQMGDILVTLTTSTYSISSQY